MAMDFQNPIRSRALRTNGKLTKTVSHAGDSNMPHQAQFGRSPTPIHPILRPRVDGQLKHVRPRIVAVCVEAGEVLAALV